MVISSAIKGPRDVSSPAFFEVLTREFFFKPVDFLAKPPFENLFALGGIQCSDSSALLIERNMVTRDIFAFTRLGNVLHENAFRARMTT